MSGFLNVELQVGFSSTKTIHAKQNFEQLASSHGVTIQWYLADNGTFKAHSFKRHIRDSNQMIKYCGVNAHHQKGIAERNIRTVSNRTRAMLLHAAIHWKDAVSSSLWPMAAQYAVYQHNNLPNREGHAPADLFTGTTFRVRVRVRVRELEEKRRFENASSRICQVTIDPSSTATSVLGPSSSLPSSNSSAPPVPVTSSPASIPSASPSVAPSGLRWSGRVPKQHQPFNVHTVSEKTYKSNTPSANFGCELNSKR